MRRTSPRPIPTRGSRPKGSGQEAKLSYMGHVLMENRHGLVVDADADARDRHRRARRGGRDG